jgi:LPXTG-motif cell wall-anchored protein
MKQNQYAKIAILLAMICLLLAMSGWLVQRVTNMLQIAALCLLLLTLFILRKKKRKSKKRAKKPAEEIAPLLESAKRDEGM